MGRSKSSQKHDKPQSTGNDRDKRENVSSNLRKIYQATIAEDVPEEMLDLLKKLG